MGYEYRNLQAFVAVSDRGTIGKAAAFLNAAQPTISRRIQVLERQVEQPLFERTPHGMALSPAGLELLPRAKLLLHEMDLAKEAMDEMRGLKRGSVRVGAVAAVARRFLPRVMAEVFRDAPSLSLQVVEGSEDQLEIALARREVDLIFMSRLPLEIETVAIGRHAYEDVCVTFCSRKLASTKSIGDVKAQNLAKLPWALPQKGSTPRLDFETICQRNGIEIENVVFECNSADAMLDFVLNSAAIGWLPRPMLTESVAKQAARILDMPTFELKRRFQPYRRSRGTFAPAARLFMDTLARHTMTK